MHLVERLVVWALASLSFTCLIGQFYALWPMSRFACLILLPATGILAAMAWHARKRPLSEQSPSVWIVQGAVGGVFAALIYDAFRLPFVLGGYPLFAVFPRFGQLLQGVSTKADPLLSDYLLGWLYHFSNGAALGIMFLAMMWSWSARTLIVGAICWAVCVEISLLLTPYYTFFQLKLPMSVFIVLTMSAHLIFGAALGWCCWFRLARRRPPATQSGVAERLA